MHHRQVSISVIIPYSNNSIHLTQCLESVIHQTLQDLEILCIEPIDISDVDDLFRTFADYDQRIRIIRSEGAYYGDMIAAGIRDAKGEYLAVIGPDDYLSPEMYSELYHAAVQNEFPALILSGYHRVLKYESGPEVLPAFPISAGSGSMVSLRDHSNILAAPPFPWACLFRKAVLTPDRPVLSGCHTRQETELLLFYYTICEVGEFCWVNRAFYYYRELSAVFSAMPGYCQGVIVTLQKIKHYLDSMPTKSALMETALLQQTLAFEGMFYSNAFFTDEERQQLHDLKSQFSRTAQRSVKLKWFTSKVLGLMKCFEEHSLSYTFERIQQTLHPPASNDLPIFDLPFTQKKAGLRVLFLSTDNNSSSGAFLCMTMLIRILREKYHTESLVILPFEGSGTALLDQYHILHCLIPSYDWVIPLSAAGTDTFKPWSLIAKARNEEAIRSITSIILRYTFDLVHINTTYSYVGAAAALRSDVPFVWHLQEFLEEDQGNTLWDRKLGNLLINRADRIIAISDAIYRKYAHIYDSHRLVRIYDGIDTSQFYQPEKTILTSSPPILIMFGAFSPAKGQVEFAKACVKLYHSGIRQFRIQFLGTGEEETIQQVRQILASGGLLSQTEFLGYVSNVQDYLRNSDLAFTCSVSEAFGRTTVEAMLSGNLMIGANSAGTKELIVDGQTGYLYHQGDPDDLCQVIIKALSDAEHSQKLAHAGREYMFKNMSAASNADLIYSLYQDILS